MEAITSNRMKTDLFYHDEFIGSFDDYQAAVSFYIDNLFENGVDEFCKGVVLHSDGSYCHIRSQFVGHRNPRQYMIASRFGGIIFDYLDPTNMTHLIAVVPFDVPSIAGFAHRAEVAFKTAAYSFNTTMRKQTAKVGEAEQKAHDKAVAHGGKIDKLTTAIVAENKAAPAVKQVQPRLNAIRLYLVRRVRAAREVVAGPFAFREQARIALRNFLMANHQVDPRQMFMLMGRELNHGKFTVAKGLRLPKVNTISVRTDARPKPTAKQIADRKTSQAAVNARRAVIRASRLVDTAMRIKRGSLYVLNKRDKIVAGPFGTLKAAHEVCVNAVDQYVQAGARCRSENLGYAVGFKPAIAPKVTGGMFAVGVPMMIAAVRTKITTYDAKTKTVCTALGTVHSCANFFINYPKAMLAVA